MTTQTVPTPPITSKTISAELKPVEIISILLIAGLGFFVDVYDLAIFAVVRIASFTNLGVTSTQLLPTGVFVLNMQMLGMILGGFLWGVLGDKKGRKFSLFGSILLYSIATFLNGYVNSIPAYAVLRFLAGIGLAGEVGAAVLIVSEITPIKYRGYAIGLMRGVGLLGAVFACLIGDRLPWRMVYISAGVAGLLLLLARMSIKETDLFIKILNNKEIKRGSLKLFFSSSKRLLRFGRCVLSAIPQWFLHGVLIAFAPEICRGLGVASLTITVGIVMLFSSCGQAFGEILACVFSERMHSRKLPVLIFLIAGVITTFIILKNTAQYYALLCIPMGFFMGYCSVVLTSTTEQFGTNLRSTATTLVPNFFRASAIPITLIFSNLNNTMGVINSTFITAAICFVLALISMIFMEETYGKNLDFVEI